MEMISANVEAFLLIIIILVLLLMVVFIAMFIRYSKVRRDYVKMMKGTNIPDLQGVMIQIQEDLIKLNAKQKNHEDDIKTIFKTMSRMKSQVGIHRYNAFSQQQGNDLSFSAAFIDEYKDGIVLTGLHSREETYIYAKPLDKGESKYALSPEEKEAINLALKRE